MVVPPFHTPKWSFLVGKPMVVGYHHFRKPPFIWCVKASVPNTHQHSWCFPSHGRHIFFIIATFAFWPVFFQMGGNNHQLVISKSCRIFVFVTLWFKKIQILHTHTHTAVRRFWLKAVNSHAAPCLPLSIQSHRSPWYGRFTMIYYASCGSLQKI